MMDPSLPQQEIKKTGQGALYRGLASGCSLIRWSLENVARSASLSVADVTHQYVLGNFPTACFTASLCWGASVEYLTPPQGVLGSLVLNTAISFSKINSSNAEEQIRSRAIYLLRSRVSDFVSNKDHIIRQYPHEYLEAKQQSLKEVRNGEILHHLSHLNVLATAVAFVTSAAGSYWGLNTHFGFKSLYGVLATTLATHTYYFFKKS